MYRHDTYFEFLIVIGQEDKRSFLKTTEDWKKDIVVERNIDDIKSATQHYSVSDIAISRQSEVPAAKVQTHVYLNPHLFSPLG